MFFCRRKSVSTTPTLANVAYGSDCSRQKLDFWEGPPDSPTPNPVLIFFHGGGFVCGSKYYCRQMRELRERGAAVIAVNYRFVRKLRDTVALPMHDSLLVFDFILKNAGEWNIDPSRIALHGKSSGGCLALWLAMKRPVRGVTAHNTPTSFRSEYLVEIGKRRIEAFWPIWGPMTDSYLPSTLKSPRVRELIENFSPLSNLHPGSPPLYLEYTADQPSGRIGWLHTLHCVRYGELMKERCDELGISCEVISPSRPPKRSALDFLCQTLGMDAGQQPVSTT
jgi:hypothetical protein